MPRKAGFMCRSADHECDLPEFCTGQSEFCPDNVFKMDGAKCHKGKVSILCQCNKLTTYTVICDELTALAYVMSLPNMRE